MALLNVLWLTLFLFGFCLFDILQAPGMPLVPLYERLNLKNVSTLALSLELTLAEPFGLCDCTSDDSFTSSKVESGMATFRLVCQKKGGNIIRGNNITSNWIKHPKNKWGTWPLWLKSLLSLHHLPLV